MVDYQNRGRLYFMHASFSFVSRMWDMGIVLLIAEVTHNSLFVVGLAGFLSSLSIFLFMPILGSYVDKMDRFKSVRYPLGVKVVSVSLSYIFIAMTAALSKHSTSQSDVSFSPVIYFVPVMAALADLSFSLVVQCIEKDWLVVLSNGDSEWLSKTNSGMSQIDLGCASVAPAVAGVLLSFCSASTASIVLLLLNAFVTLGLYFFMKSLYYSCPALAVKTLQVASPSPSLSKKEIKNDEYSVMSQESVHDLQDENLAEQEVVDFRASIDVESKASDSSTIPLQDGSFLERKRRQIMEFIEDFSLSGCGGVMISYAFLYCTVLSFGSLMTVYLRWGGMSDYYIGICRGANALFGFLGASIFPFFQSRWGLWHSGEIAIIYQFVLVFVACSSFFFMNRFQSMITVVVAVLFSRVGLWMFDLSARQIAQESIPEDIRGKVNGQWRSTIAFFDMSGYFMALIFPSPTQFWLLTTISGWMIFSALVIFTRSNPHSTKYWASITSSLGSLLPASLIIPLSNHYENLFVNQEETGIEISTHPVPSHYTTEVEDDLEVADQENPFSPSGRDKASRPIFATLNPMKDRFSAAQLHDDEDVVEVEL